MESIYGSYRHKKISHSAKEVTEKMACLIGVEPTAFRLGVLKNSQNPIKISNFRTFLGVLSNIFRLNRLFCFLFSVNFRFQNNFQTKIIPKTIPIFQARFQKFLANMKIILSYFFLVSAVAVRPAGGKGVLPHKIRHTAGFTHGIV